MFTHFFKIVMTRFRLEILMGALLSVSVIAFLPTLTTAASPQAPISSEIATTTAPTLIFLGNKNIAPVVYLQNGVPTGLAVDILEALAKYIPQSIQIKPMDWSEAQTLVAQGDADALIQINQTEERKKIYDFSEPLLESHFSIFTQGDRTGITSITSLEGLRVGVEAAGLPQNLLSRYPNITLVVIPDFLTAFKNLEAGSIDAVVVDYRVGSYVIAQNNLQGIKVIGDPISPSYSSFAVKKGNVKLLNQINIALETIKANGVYQQILNKWKSSQVIFQTEQQIAQEIFFLIIFILSILLIVAFLWMRSTNSELKKRKIIEKEKDEATIAIREREAEFSAIFYGSPDLIAITGASDGKIIEVNDGYTEMLGYSRDESIGKTTSELDIWVNPADRNMFVSMIQKSGEISDFETMLRRKDGTIISVSDSARSINIKGVDCILSTAHDISEHKKLVEVMNEREADLSAIIENSPVATIIDTGNESDEKVIMLNKEFTKLFGYTQEDLPSAERWWELAYPDELERMEMSARFTTSIAHTRQNGNKIDSIETMVTCKNGARRFVRISLSPLETKNIITFEDLTDIREAHKKIEIQNTILQTAQEVSLDAILVVDENARILSYNKNFIDMWGLPPELIAAGIDDPVLKFVSEKVKNSEAFFARVKYLYEQHEEITREEVLLKDGRILDLYSTPIKNEMNAYRGRVWYLRDITSERELEETRRDLLSLASHQLRTPLSGTKWLIETLQSGLKGPLNVEQVEYLDELYKVNEKMIMLVHDMLDVLRMESGILPSEIEAVSLNTIFSNIMGALGVVAKSKHLDLRISQGENYIISTDASLFQNILEIFVSNAISYSPEGKEILVSAQRQNDEILVSIKDSGIGIPEDERGRIFEQFYRASNAKTFDTKGTGLGLYIATILAKKIGVQFSFESELGKGSIFYVHIPDPQPKGLPEGTTRV